MLTGSQDSAAVLLCYALVSNRAWGIETWSRQSAALDAVLFIDLLTATAAGHVVVHASGRTASHDRTATMLPNDISFLILSCSSYMPLLGQVAAITAPSDVA